MKLRIIIPFLFLLGVGMMRSENYVVTVYGVLVDGQGNGVPNKTIYINNTKNSKFKVTEKTSTYGNGDFKWPVNIPDSIEQGALLLSYINCNDKEVIIEVHFTKQNNITQSKLIFCERELSTNCASVITVRRVNDTLSIAVVTNKGMGPFKHKWSNGQNGNNQNGNNQNGDNQNGDNQNGDTTSFNTKNDDNICVESIDAGGCISTYCVNDQSDHKCKVEIIIKKLTDSTSIAIAVGKGTAPFKYKWTNGSVNDTITYHPGTINSGYCVVVSDSTGCLSFACIATESRCKSEVFVKRINDTVALAYVISKGKGPFTHTWTTGQTGDSIYFNPLNKIKICVRSVDTSGCVAEACVTSIPEPCKGSIERSGNVLYAYLKNDVVKTYLWSNGSHDAKIEVKEIGEYCVLMIGLHGCESRVCFAVKELDTIHCIAEIIASKLPLGTNTDAIDGYKLSINARFPLKYIYWNTGDTTPSIIVRKTGEYCVSISDNVHCKLYVCKKIEVEPVHCTLKILIDSIPTPSSTAVKRVKLTAVPSYDPKIIVWSTNETTKSITVEKSGKYCVTVSDGIGCKLQECITIELGTPPPPPPTDCSSSIVVHPISASEVKLVPRVSGTVPFTFLWTTGSKDATINVKTSGYYCVSIKDGRGCISKACTEIAFEEIGSGVLGPLGDEKNKVLNPTVNKANIELNVFPNPSQDKVNYIVKTKQDQDGILNVSNIYGKLVYQEKIKFQGGISKGDLDLSFLGAGVYQVTIDQGGYVTTSKIVIAK